MDPEPLRLFVAPTWRRDDIPPTPLLYPFWGNPPSSKKPLYRALFERHTFDTTKYTLTDDISSAHMVLLPYNHAAMLAQAPNLLELCIKEAALHNKPLLIDGLGDIERPIEIPNSVVLRWGGYRFLKKENEIHIPFFADDLLEAYCFGNAILRKKQLIPTVSFAGWASMTPMQTLRAVLKELPLRARGIVDARYRACKKGIFFRTEALRALERSNRVKTTILRRSSYSGNTATVQGDPSMLQKEMVNMLLESDYGLDVRGDANNSMRLFEILSLGRIPVIVDTERNFPFSDQLDYSSFSLRVDFKELHNLPDIVRKFHDSLSDEKFTEMQQRARAAYREYFRVDALTKHLVAQLRNRL
jgi:hypothetical protein